MRAKDGETKVPGQPSAKAEPRPKQKGGSAEFARKTRKPGKERKERAPVDLGKAESLHADAEAPKKRRQRPISQKKTEKPKSGARAKENRSPKGKRRQRRSEAVGKRSSKRPKKALRSGPKQRKKRPSSGKKFTVNQICRAPVAVVNKAGHFKVV